jgi:hypothetical protein
MTEHVLTMKNFCVDIHRQPRCTDDDHAAMIKNKLRVYRSTPESVMLQIRGEKNFASASLSVSDVQWLIDALNAETFEPENALRPRVVA